MRKCASQAGIHPAMLSYAGKNVKNDFQFIASVIINSNGERINRTEYPMEALREAVANALIVFKQKMHIYQ